MAQSLDLEARIRQYLGSAVFERVVQVGRLGASTGHRVYLVGGTVRDILLFARAPKARDVDLAVEGSGPEFASEVARVFGGTLGPSSAFGTVTWTSSQGVCVDIASTRCEHYPSPGHLPVVRPCPLLDDLIRRDFAANAMAIDVADAFRLIDPHGGQRDVEKKILRILHSASFVDDPTRIFRAARFAVRLGFRLHPSSQRLLRQALDGGALETLTLSRLGSELHLCLGETHPAAVFRRLSRWRVLESLIVDFDCGALVSALKKTESLPAHFDANARVGARWLLLAQAIPLGSREHFAALAGPHLRPALFAKGTGSAHEAVGHLSQAQSKAQIARCLRKLSAAHLALAYVFSGRADAAKIRWWVRKGCRVETPVTGNTLLQAGISPGPAIAAGINAALDAAYEGASVAKQHVVALKVAKKQFEFMVDS